MRLSKVLVEQIIEAANGKMMPAVLRAHETDIVDNKWADYIYDTLFGDIKPILNKIPSNWFKLVTYFEVCRVGDLDCYITFPFQKPTPWPYKFPVTELAEPRSQFIEENNRIVLKNHLVWGELYAIVAANKNRIKEANQRKADFVNGVKKILDSCNTLAQALSVWPPLWELVSDEVKQKYREPKKVTNPPVVEDVDLDWMTVTLTAAKLGV